MSVDDMREKIKKMKRTGEDPIPYELEIHERYAIPFTCLVFALIGVPLGIQPRRSGRSYGFVLSMLIILAYYISRIVAETLAMDRTISPLLGGWAPNLLFTGLAVYLFVKAANESPIKPIVWLAAALDWIQQKWKGFTGDI